MKGRTRTATLMLSLSAITLGCALNEGLRTMLILKPNVAERTEASDAFADIMAVDILVRGGFPRTCCWQRFRNLLLLKYKCTLYWEQLCVIPAFHRMDFVKLPKVVRATCIHERTASAY